MAVAFEIDVHDMSNLGHLSVGDIAISREQDTITRQVLRNGYRNGIAAVALRTALQQVEVFAVIGEFDVDGLIQFGLEEREQFADITDEGRLADETFESKDSILPGEIGRQSDGLLDAV